MEKLTFYDLNKIIEKIADSHSSHFELIDLLDHDSVNETTLNNMVSKKFADEIEKIGKFKIVHDNDKQFGGYGENIIIKVFHFIDHDIYVQLKGVYSSYSGIQFESIREVKPITKTVTVYE